MPYKDPQERKDYAKRYRAANKEKQAALTKRWRKDNKEAIREKKRLENEALKDDFYTLYYLPEEHYIGVTCRPKMRMKKHRTEGNRITKGYEVVSIFNTKKEALDTERFMHDYLDYNGKNLNYNTKKYDR
jgi:predicted GIY-YIG superfamily endonuclease